MENNAPVYTLLSACQDCYRCLRHCHVKAINVHQGHAKIVQSRCLNCGQCVPFCPRQAKKFRDDLGRVFKLFEQQEMVAVSLAPSWRGATGFNRPRLIAALKALGVGIVSETALGAEAVSMGTTKILNQAEPGLYISSCCPVTVDYIRLYKPSFAKNLIPLASPALTHAKLLKDLYGDELKVIFIGPCVAKKSEADRHPNLLSAALTFGELKRWMRDNQFDVNVMPIDAEATFNPERSFEGALYALSGGMIEGLKKAGLKDSVQTMTLTSLEQIGRALEALAGAEFRHPIFIEAMACETGCVNGPAISTDRSNILAISDLLRHVQHRPAADPSAPYTKLQISYQPGPITQTIHPPDEIQIILAQLGKYLPDDEINCSGCGYSSCRELASAILDGAAEPEMCISNMRRLATRKAAALVKAMPSAIVMVDRQMNILEVNESFIRMFVESPTNKLRPDELVGTPVSEWIEFGGLIRRVLKTGEDIHKEHRLYKGKLFNLYMFSVEKYSIAGAIVTDVTSLKAGRASLSKKVREVIDRNISTVQEIACLLGEHMVETELILTAVAGDLEAEYDDDLEEENYAPNNGETQNGQSDPGKLGPSS
ncbi:MAG: PAS domain-containing protein [Deltaproteobacteria bacterium]|jgi:iron only hydrogenase large subunit-like protein|nr:PAS domain-containing protein [Deltaproteobacteria bacterium]